MANLANTYRPSTWEDVTEQKLVVDMLKSMCDDPNFNTRNFLLIGPAGCGKALLNSEKVLSVDGFKRIDEIRVGDKVITETGDIALVDGVFPQKESKDIYELIFENTNCTEHRSICVSIDHLNSVYLTQKDDEHWEQGTRLSALVTEDLIRLFDAGYNIWITNMLNIICNSASLLNCEKVLEAVNNSGLEDDSTDMLLLTDIKFRGTCPCTCIHVDHESHTFVGGDFIPTHNTTLARIMGNYVNEGKGEPIEIDAASNNGIDAVRNIIDQARSYPVGQNWKVFILDEVHAFSNQAWQALLKTLESGAGKTLFFMATTNPEKIPATILSRVQTFQLSKISLQGIHDRLCYVLESEKSKGQPITYTDDAVNFVAKMANGGMRDSLTLLDKCLAFSNDITIENVTQALNLPEYDDFFELLSAYAKKNNVKITEIVDRVYNSGVNFVKWFENFHSFVINIVKYIYLQDISKTMIPSTYQDKISKYGNPHLVVCLKLANKLMKMNHELKSTQYLQEVALTNLCFVPAPAKKG